MSSITNSTIVWNFTILNPPKGTVVVNEHLKQDRPARGNKPAQKKCRYPETKTKRDCVCPKYLLISPGSHRISANTNNWGEAEDTLAAFIREHDPRIVKPTSNKTANKLILEAISECIWSFTKKKDLDPGTQDKMWTLYRAVEEFINEWNAKVKTEKEKLVYIHQITTHHLEEMFWKWDKEMPEKIVHIETCLRDKSCTCEKVRPPMTKSEKQNRRSYLVRFFDYALDNHWIEDNGRTAIKGQMKRPIRLSNPAAHLEVTGRKSRAEDKKPLSDRLYYAYLWALGVYCVNRKCNHTDPNLYSRIRTYLRFLKKTGYAKIDGMLAEKKNCKRDSMGWYFEIRRTKTDKKPAQARISDAFYEELMNVQPGMKPIHPDYIFYVGTDLAKAQKKAKDIVAKSGDKIDYEKALRDAKHMQETNAGDTIDKLFRKLTALIPKEILYAECNKDEFDILIEPTLHCFRYTFATDFQNAGGNLKQMAHALGDEEDVAKKHYAKESSELDDQVRAILLRMSKREDMDEASAIQQFGEGVLQ